MIKTIIYMPIETKVRELKAKLLFASHAAEQGFIVIFGQKNELDRLMAYMPRGIYFGLGLMENFSNGFREREKRGHKNVAFDEEGLVFYDEEQYKKYRLSNKTFDYLEKIFTWGDVQAGLVESSAFGANKNKIVKTGSIRLDLLKDNYLFLFKKECDELKNKYGNYVLINTNFGPCNHFNGKEFYIESLRKKGMMRNKEDVEYHLGRIEHSNEIYESFIEMIRLLSGACKDQNFIIRPHPSENVETWINTVRGLENVKVVNSGNVISWILGASALIHNGCTTGIEGYLLRVPVIAYRAVTSEIYDMELPNSVSHNVFNVEELIEVIRNIASGHKNSYINEHGREILANYISNMNGYAYEKIIKEFKEIKVNNNTFEMLKLSGVYVYLLRTFFKLKDLIRKFIFHDEKYDLYAQHKFLGIKVEEIDDILNSLGAEPKKIRQLFGSTYMIKV